MKLTSENLKKMIMEEMASIEEAHDGVHVEGAVDEVIAFAAQGALRYIEENAPQGTIPHEQIPFFVTQLCDAMRSIIEELQDLAAEAPSHPTDIGYPGTSPKYRG
jgi:hypothetical protein